MYTVFVRYYSMVEGLLVWKHTFIRSSFEDSVQFANRLLAQELVSKYPVRYSSESDTYHESYGSYEHVRCMQLHPCNIQIREDGKFVAWRNI